MTQQILTREEARRQGMRSSIGRFAVKYDLMKGQHIPGTVIVECINMETGEINTYMCNDKPTARYIANTWWMTQDKEEAIIRIKGMFWANVPGGIVISEKHVKQGVPCNKDMGNELDWYYLFNAGRLYEEMGHTTRC